jgi:phosphatidylglycerol:prolipoprotein diacylglycerol transferase
MLPDLFSIGPLTLHTYGLLVAAGFVIGLFVALWIGKRQGISPQQVMDMGFIIILSAIIGSRFVYVIMNASYYWNHPIDIFKLWEGGLVFSGGLILVILAMSLYIRHYRLPFWQIGDLWAPAAAIGQSIGRVGCFMAGCCYGRPTDVSWGVVFTNPKSLAPLNQVLHPTQLYSSLSGLIIFIVLIVMHVKKRFDGQVFLWFLILHSTARLLIERFRGDDRGYIAGINMSVTQAITIIILIAAVVMLFVRRSRVERENAL